MSNVSQNKNIQTVTTSVVGKTNSTSSIMLESRTKVLENDIENVQENNKRLMVDIDRRFNEISDQIGELNTKMTTLVSIERFKPVELIAYGFAGGVGSIIMTFLATHLFGG